MAVQVDTIGIVFVPCRRPLPRDSRLQRSHRPAREQFVDEPRQLVEVKLNPTALKRHVAIKQIARAARGHGSGWSRCRWYRRGRPAPAQARRHALLSQWIYEEFRITVAKQTLTRELPAMGYRNVSSLRSRLSLRS